MPTAIVGAKQKLAFDFDHAASSTLDLIQFEIWGGPVQFAQCGRSTVRYQAASVSDRTYENALPPRRPSFLKTIAAGQNPVNAAWIMFNPANAVSRNQ